MLMNLCTTSLPLILSIHYVLRGTCPLRWIAPTAHKDQDIPWVQLLVSDGTESSGTFLMPWFVDVVTNIMKTNIMKIDSKPMPAHWSRTSMTLQQHSVRNHLDLKHLSASTSAECLPAGKVKNILPDLRVSADCSLIPEGKSFGLYPFCAIFPYLHATHNTDVCSADTWHSLHSQSPVPIRGSVKAHMLMQRLQGIVHNLSLGEIDCGDLLLDGEKSETAVHLSLCTSKTQKATLLSHISTLCNWEWRAHSAPSKSKYLPPHHAKSASNPTSQRDGSGAIRTTELKLLEVIMRPPPTNNTRVSILYSLVWPSHI